MFTQFSKGGLQPALTQPDKQPGRNDQLTPDQAVVVQRARSKRRQTLQQRTAEIRKCLNDTMLLWQAASCWTPDQVARVFPPSSSATVIQTWAKQLVQFTPETVAKATQRAINEGGEFPPTLGPFKKMCRESVDRAAHDDSWLGTWNEKAPKRDNDLNRQGMDQVRAIMRGEV